MKKRFVNLFALFLIVVGIVTTCCEAAAAMGVSKDKEVIESNGSEVVLQVNEEIATEPTQEPTQEPTVETTEVEETVVPETTAPPSEYYDDYFSSEITFESQYIREDGVMPYALYTPSTLDETKKTPLIVWLHGSGQVGKGESSLFNSGLLKALGEWELEGFNAYIICPQLSGSFNTGRWNKESTKNNLQTLLDKFIEEHNIDQNQIFVVGHSLGGQGALYMAHQLPEYFSRCVVLSGYNPGIEISEITIPTIGITGTQRAGEDGGSISYMKNYCQKTFGEEKIFFIEASHGGIPKAAFNLDSDEDMRSDVVEWLFGDFEY